MKRSSTSPQTDHRVSTVRVDALFKSHVNFRNTASIGLRSGPVRWQGDDPHSSGCNRLANTRNLAEFPLLLLDATHPDSLTLRPRYPGGDSPRSDGI